MAAISSKNGVDLVMNFDKSIDQTKFIKFLRTLRRKYPFDKMALFMDRLSVHRCRQVQSVMKELKLGWVLNASYSPDFNPIEGVFSIVKNHIKRKRLEAIVQGKRIHLEGLIKEAFERVSKESCVNLI